ncbi:MAG: NAD-dependent epimerase/dehydratase family protein, partial [Hydrogenophaga sp.]
MKIAVTGASGFTGRHFVQHAREAGHEVCFLEANLTDAEAVRRCEATAWSGGASPPGGTSGTRRGSKRGNTRLMAASIQG